MSEAIQFDDIDSMKRNPEVEGKTGTVVDFPDNPDGTPRGMRLLAASDLNPRWKARAASITKELARLRNAEASNKRVRDYLAREFAECCVIEWWGWRSKGIEIPLSVEAATALLRQADDTYATVDAIVWDNKNFRGERIKAVVENLEG